MKRGQSGLNLITSSPFSVGVRVCLVFPSEVESISDKTHHMNISPEVDDELRFPINILIFSSWLMPPASKCVISLCFNKMLS